MIEIRNLNKSFRVHRKQPGLLGSMRALVWRDWLTKHALVNVNLDIAPGEIVGLLGANGAGKTTLVKILSGIIHPSGDASKVRVMGFDPWQRKNEYRRKIALIMGQKAQLWWDLPAADCFLLLKEIYQIPTHLFQERLENLTATLDVKDVLTTQIRRLSLGERMKMELIAALLHAPQIVFFDEPTIGLDITSQRKLREFILTYHKKYKPTMIVTSHYMEDIESLCKRIIILREGHITHDGDLLALKNKYALYKFVSVAFAASSQHSEPSTWQRLSDIDKNLHDNWGVILQVGEAELKVKVNRERVSEVSTALLNKLKIVDLNIEELDVGTIIAAIQSEGKFSHA